MAVDARPAQDGADPSTILVKCDVHQRIEQNLTPAPRQTRCVPISEQYRAVGPSDLFPSHGNSASLISTITASDLSVSICLASEKTDIATLWCNLETRAGASFFLSWDWIGYWLRESQVSPYPVVARHQDRVVAMALLLPSRRRGHHVLRTNALMLNRSGNSEIDIITIEHNGILIDRDFVSVTMQACSSGLIRDKWADGGLDWDELHLTGLAAPKGLRQSGGLYLDLLSAYTRHQIRRSTRFYEKRGGLSATPVRNVDEAMRYCDHMKELHQRYWCGRGQVGSFAYPFFERFHRALIKDCLPKGTVELVMTAAGGEPVGHVYNFVSDNWVYAYFTDFRYEEDPTLKPGLVSHHLCIARQGARLYHFLAGNERYKTNLARPGPDIGYLILQPSLPKLRAERIGRWHKSIGQPHPASNEWTDTVVTHSSFHTIPSRASRGRMRVYADEKIFAWRHNGQSRWAKNAPKGDQTRGGQDSSQENDG